MEGLNEGGKVDEEAGRLNELDVCGLRKGGPRRAEAAEGGGLRLSPSLGRGRSAEGFMEGGGMRLLADCLLACFTSSTERLGALFVEGEARDGIESLRVRDFDRLEVDSLKSFGTLVAVSSTALLSRTN